jgi:hypothetical protein
MMRPVPVRVDDRYERREEASQYSLADDALLGPGQLLMLLSGLLIILLRLN